MHGNSLGEVVDFAVSVVQEAWRDLGYLRAKVEGDGRIMTSNAVAQQIAVSIHINEGPLYALGDITFKHNRALDAALLRHLFPIEHGETASRAKIAKGLENLKKAYDELGYLNYTPIPTPTFDDQSRVVSFEIEIDEGKQFRIGALNIVGVDNLRREALSRAFPVGHVYSEEEFRQFLEQQSFDFSAFDRRYVQKHLDERKGTVEINLDARDCGFN